MTTARFQEIIPKVFSRLSEALQKPEQIREEPQKIYAMSEELGMHFLLAGRDRHGEPLALSLDNLRARACHREARG